VFVNVTERREPMRRSEDLIDKRSIRSLFEVAGEVSADFPQPLTRSRSSSDKTADSSGLTYSDIGI